MNVPWIRTRQLIKNLLESTHVYGKSCSDNGRAKDQAITAPPNCARKESEKTTAGNKGSSGVNRLLLQFCCEKSKDIQGQRY